MQPAGDVATAVQRLLSSSEAAKAMAASDLAELACSGEGQCAAIVAAGAERPLVALLQSGSSMVQHSATIALCNLAQHGGASACTALVAAGAIPGLVGLLQCGGTSTCSAVRALANLAVHSEDQAEAFLVAGAVPDLVQLCGCTDWSTRAHAAWADLGSMAACAQAIAAARGIEALAAILLNGAADRGGGGGSSSSTCKVAQLHAIDAIRSLATDGPAMRAAIAAAAGLPAALVQRLADDRFWEKAARCIQVLVFFHHPEACAAIAAAGGIAALAERLASSSSGSGGRSSSGSAAGLEHVVGALLDLADGSSERSSTILSSGCVPHLVQLLGSEADVQLNAVWALHSLVEAMSASAAAAIAAAGGVPALLGLISASQERLVIPCAAVLWYLADNGQVSPAQAAAALPTLERLCCSPDSAISITAGCTATKLRPLLSSVTSTTMPAGLPQAARTQREQHVQPAQQQAQQAQQQRPEVQQQQERQQHLEHEQQQQQAQQQPQRPLRVCAAPGCGSTTSLRRCGGCGIVRYCSEACSKAHWRAHKPECRRLRAERDAAAGASASSSTAMGAAQP